MSETRRSFAEHPPGPWKADAVVIGAGAGGAAAAAALSEAGLSVLVLEEGSAWRPEQFEPDSTWAYRHIYAGRGTRSTVGNVAIPVPGGRGVGGSTLINSAICFRTPEAILREWSTDYGCSRLTPERMSPLLDRVWSTIGATVNPLPVQKMNNLIFQRGVERLGLPGRFLTRSAPGCVGCGVCQMGCPSGGKWSVDRTFLRVAEAQGRVRTIADLRVEGVVTEGDRVVAVTGQRIDPATLLPAGEVRIDASIFVLSAGPIGSPRFLMRNGLASGEVGQHLHLHPASGVLARMEEAIEPWTGVTQGYYVDRWERGYLLQTFTTTPDQVFVGMPWSFGEAGQQLLLDLRYMASAGPLVHDVDSVGSVGERLLRYDFGEQDRATMIAGLRECVEVFFAAGAREVYPGVVGARPLRSLADLDEVLPLDLPVGRLYLYASHPMGTCRMGADPGRSVVDPEGRVWGWRNLHVADASIFPTSLGVNPQVTTMAVGLMVGAAAAEGKG